MRKINFIGLFWATVCAVYLGSIVWGLMATWTKPCFNVLERIVMTLLMLVWGTYEYYFRYNCWCWIFIYEGYGNSETNCREFQYVKIWENRRGDVGANLMAILFNIITMFPFIMTAVLLLALLFPYKIWQKSNFHI